MNTENVEIRRSGDASRARDANDAKQVLAEILAGGARDSREALTAMEVAGFSLKQTRTARERLSVVIEREGNGRGMRSLWRLPGRTAPGTPPLAPAAPDLPSHIAAVTAPVVPAGVGPRFSRRVRFFTDRGLAIGEATELAHALDVRDLGGSRTVSCAECACWVHRSWCGSRRPAIELHLCDSARRDAP